MPLFSFLASKKIFFIFSGLFFLGGIIFLFWYFQFFSTEQVFAKDQFVLHADSFDALGVEPTTTFLLESKVPVRKDVIKNYLHVEGVSQPQLEQVSKNSIRIAFADPLPQNKIIKFALQKKENGDELDLDRKYSWAFQVKKQFRVLGTIPGDHSTQVPLNAAIEISFSHENIDPKDFEQAISITPSLNGKVEYSRRIFVFVPEKLEPKTLYTVKIAGDLHPTGSEESLEQDYIFQFETAMPEEIRGASLNVEEHFIATTPKSTVRIPYYSSDSDTVLPQTQKVHVKIFGFSSYESYRDALLKAKDFVWQSFATPETFLQRDKLSLVTEFDPEVVQEDWRQILLFPKSIDRGYYLAEFSYKDARDWALIESSNLTSYIAEDANQTLVWVNSALTNGPISGASVKYIFQSEEGITNKEGLVYIPTPSLKKNAEISKRQEDEMAFIEIQYNDDVLALPLNQASWITNSYLERDQIDRFWSYLYTDRPLYKPGDTLNFWGFLSDRKSGDHPNELRVWIGQKDWTCNPYACEINNDLVFDEIKVTPTARGTFLSKLDLRDVPPGFYSVSVMSGEEEIMSRGIQVSEYLKPAFTLDLNIDTDAAFVEEEIHFVVRGSFFEGTPVKGLPVRVSSANVSDQVLTLDEKGEARGVIVFPYTDDGEYRAYPTNQWISVRPDRPEEGQIEGNDSLMLFGPKVYLDIPWNKAEIENRKGHVEIFAREVEALNSWDQSEFGKKFRANQVVSGKLKEITYQSYEIGSSYDFIQKQVVKRYGYNRVEKIIDSFSLTTNNEGKALYEFSANNKEANYIIMFQATDEKGRKDYADIFVYQKREYEGASFGGIYFKNLDAPDSEPFLGYQIGKEAHLQVWENEKPFVMPKQGQFLFFQALHGIQETSLSKDIDYTFSFEERDVPNVTPYGVLFNGEGYADFFHSGIFFNKENREISITFQADKEEYRPGDEAKITVITKNKEGKGIASDVNLNVVDEAFYALAPEDVDPLGELYRWVDSGILMTKVSQNIQALSGGAEKGGGGGRGRFIFKDTAFFQNIVTNEDGYGEIQFQLPQNITSWRVTAQAIDTKNKFAGDAKIQLTTTLPLFVTPVLRDVYLEADKPIALIRAGGKDIGVNEEITYRVAIAESSFGATLKAKATETVRVPLPKLKNGKHEITISATVRDITDTITRFFEIIPSHLVKPVVEITKLSPGQNIPHSNDGLTSVTFVDAGRGQVYSLLYELLWSGGDRADQVAVAWNAAQLLQKEFNENISTPEFRVENYQDDLGIRLLPYADPDFSLTARLAMLGKGPWYEDKLLSYLFTRVNFGGRGQIMGGALDTLQLAQGYAGLAALGEPVLLEVKRFLNEPDLEISERLYLALALHFLGDDEGARNIYRELVSQTVEKDRFRYFPEKDQETSSEITGLFLILSGALSESERDSFRDFIWNSDPGNTLLALEKFLFIKETLPHLSSSQAEITYTFLGERKTQKLSHGETFTLPLSAGEVETLRPEVSSGEVMVVSRYKIPGSEIEKIGDSSLGIRRTYFVGDEAKTSFHEGDLIKVKLEYSLPIELNRTNETENQNILKWYEITDAIPSGLVPLSDPWLATGFFGENDLKYCIDFPYQITQQRISFLVSSEPRENSRCGNNTLFYYARVVTPGEYLAESAFIRSSRDPEIFNRSQEMTLVISE